MQCNHELSALGCYLDGELRPEEAAAVQEQIGSCPGCAAEIAELTRLRVRLRPARARFVPSPEFRRKIQRQVARPARPNLFRWLVPASVAAAVVIALVAFVSIHALHRADTLTEVADLHVNTLASANPFDVVSTDRHTVKPWFQGRVPFSFNVPELAGTQFTLLGGRLAYLHRQPAAQLIVGVRLHKISVLILEESPEMKRAFPLPGSIRDRNSFTAETWSSRDLRFFVIGDTEPADIHQLAHTLQVANQ
jgi:anti-sigma factor RsiW